MNKTYSVSLTKKELVYILDLIHDDILLIEREFPKADHPDKILLEGLATKLALPK